MKCGKRRGAQQFRGQPVTLFALTGAIIAGLFLVAFLGFHWILVPGALGALVSMYFVSTRLGRIARSRPRGLVTSMLIGPGVAIATFLAGVIGLGIPNIFMAWLEDVTMIRTGMGPFTSLAHSAEDYLLTPFGFGSFFGWWIILFLGVFYGTTLMEKNTDQ